MKHNPGISSKKYATAPAFAVAFEETHYRTHSTFVQDPDQLAEKSLIRRHDQWGERGVTPL
jgi:hypothetical protein